MGKATGGTRARREPSKARKKTTLRFLPLFRQHLAIVKSPTPSPPPPSHRLRPLVSVTTTSHLSPRPKMRTAPILPMRTRTTLPRAASTFHPASKVNRILEICSALSSPALHPLRRCLRLIARPRNTGWIPLTARRKLPRTLTRGRMWCATSLDVTSFSRLLENSSGLRAFLSPSFPS
jgi:hypothetical protein